MSVHVRLHHPVGRITLDVAFDAAGGLTALVGPSGAGKTSVLNAIAGLLAPRAGRIAIHEHVVVDTAARIFVPPHQRRVGYVFQDARLFPHLSVRANISYGKRFAAAPAIASADDVIAMMGLAALLERRPATLSGGERQRVAIARALLAAPRLLLLDEPLASVDSARKDDILPYLDRLRDQVRLPMLYVTHNHDEVLSRAARTIHMDEGRSTTAT